MLASLAVLLAGVVPAGAQQRVEIKLRSPRAESSDSSSQGQFRRLQRTLDSLTRVYNESEDLTASDRRRIETNLTSTLAQLESLVDRMNAEPGERLPRAQDIVRFRLAPGMAERAAASMSRELLQVQEMDEAAPRGWIGLVTQGAGTLPRIEGGQWLVRYFSYPRIVSVDPSSPAERAGLAPNDTLLAYNGRDVRENEISLTRLLVPNARVIVKVRRDGRVRDFPVTVVAAPTRIAQRRDEEVRDAQDQWVVAGVPKAALFPRAPMPSTPPPSGTLRATTRLAPTPTPPASASSPMVAPLPPRPGFVWSYSTGGVAGAQLTTINDGLARALGVSQGVLVTSAPVGSPANESGVMDGDIIVKVSSQSVRNVAQVRELVALATENGGKSVDVELLRLKKTVKIQLKW